MGHTNGTPDRSGDAADDAAASFGLADADDRWLDLLRDTEREPIAEVNGYELFEEIGRGGQGVVYRARETGSGLAYALKALHRPSPDRRAAVARERRSIARLDHPSLIASVGAFDASGAHWEVYPLIEGVQICEHCDALGRNEQVSRRVAPLFIDLATALHHAHQQGVIHRDLKPSNVLVREENGKATPVVLDFGSAATFGGADTQADLTVSHRLALTPAFASPEQARGEGDADIRTDIYSLGVLLFRCLTGEMPYDFDRSNMLRTLDVIRSASPRRADERALWVDRALASIVHKALEKSPAERYQSMEALASDLRAWCEGLPTSVGTPTFFGSLRRAAREHRAASALLVALLATVVAASAATSVMAFRAIDASRRADSARRASDDLNHLLRESLGAALASRDGTSARLIDSLEGVAERARADLAGHPEYAADVLLTVGETYRTLWRYEESVPHLRRALALYESVDDPPALKLARALSVLGTALTSLNEPEAVALQERALEIRTARLGESHSLTLESMVKLGYALHRAHNPPDFERARTLMSGALAGYRAIHDGPHRETGSCIHNLAYLTLRMRNYDAALDLYRGAIQEFRAAGATDDHFYAEALHTFTSVIANEEHAGECVALLDEAIPLVRRIYGEERTWPLYERRARLLPYLGRHAEARRDWREAVASRIVAMSDTGVLTRADAYAIESMIWAADEESSGDADVVLGVRAGLGSDEGRHLDRLILMVARLHLRAERAPVARDIVERLIAQGLGDDASLWSLTLLGECCAEVGDMASAERAFRAALDVEPSRQTRWTADRARLNLGACLMDQGRVDEAEPFIHEAREAIHGRYGISKRLKQAADDAVERLDRLRGLTPG